MAEVYLSIGTNLGAREENIARAIFMLSEALGTHPDAVSSTIESPAWGFDGPDFLDCVARFSVRTGPLALLGICKRIEMEMGRRETVEHDSGGHRIYHDRIIDIDILLYGNVVMDTPELTIPHPHLHERRFILDCLAELGLDAV